MGFDSQFDEEKEPIMHVMVDQHLYALVNVGKKDDKLPEASKSAALDDSFASSDAPWNTSGEDTELLPSGSQAADPMSIVIPEVPSDPTIGRLVSIDDSNSPVDSDISSLVDQPKEWVQRKKVTKTRSQSSKKLAPPRPPPYQNHSRASASPPPLSSDDDSISPHNVSPSQSMDSDTQLMISTSKAGPPKLAPPKTRPKPAWISKAHTEQQLPMVREGEDVPDGLFNLSLFKGHESRSEEVQDKEKTHNRSTSWDLTKMIREEHGMCE